MKMIILLAGSLTLAATSQLAAEPGKNMAKGQGKGNNSTMSHGGGKSAAKAQKHGGGKAAANARRNGTDRIARTDRNGRMYAMDARGNCPPGLAKKNNGCTPPGQAKKQYDVGQRYNTNFGKAWSYNQIPEALRTQYKLDQSDQYYYNQGYIYRVDQQSNLVEQVISAVLR